VIKIFGDECSYEVVSLCISAVVSFSVGAFWNFQLGSLMLGANIIVGLAIVLYRMEEEDGR